MCQVGYRICNNDGTWSDCIGETEPQIELCFTSFDEDCDGIAGLQDPDCAGACGELTACGTVDCFDIQTDSNNCGSCGQVCGSYETCEAGVCISSVSCNDGLACTQDSPDGSGGCINSIQGGNCVIAGVCYGDGQTNPDSSCMSCNSAFSQTSWTKEPADIPCGNQSNTACDKPDTCDIRGYCQTNIQSSSTVCRTATGLCDVTENCDGTTGICPPNSYASASTVCRTATGLCDVTENCTGTTGNCPSDFYAIPGTFCGTNSVCTETGICIAVP